MYLSGVDIFLKLPETLVRTASQSALLLIRSVRSNKALLLEKVTKLQKKKIENSEGIGEYHSRKDNIISKRKGQHQA